MLAGEPYRADDPALIVAREQCQALLRRVNAGEVPVADVVARLGEGSEVLTPLRCDYGRYVEIGDRTFVNYGLTVLDAARVVIGDDVLLGPNVQLIAATHPLGFAERASGWESAHPIRIGNGAWLGAGVIVLPGVTVGARSVVGAGSVVTRDVPPDVVAVGSPARVVRALPRPIELSAGDVVVRTPLPADAAELRRIHLTPEVTRWWGPMADDFPDDAREEVYLTIVARGKVAGHIQFTEELEPDYKAAGIDLFVDPARHRQGIGSAAIRLVIEHLTRDRGHHRITIDPATENAPAIACYASVGFEPVGVTRASWYDHAREGWSDDLLMQLVVRSA